MHTNLCMYKFTALCIKPIFKIKTAVNNDLPLADHII